MDSILARLDKGTKQTLGHFSFFEGTDVAFQCKTLELPWKDNEQEESCIPPGLYTVVKHRSPKYGLCLKVIDVKGREHILFHWGNFVENTLGCILVGAAHSDINKDGLKDVTNSKQTFRRLMRTVPRKFEMLIV